MNELSTLEVKVLRACSGEVVMGLPYDDAQREASKRLQSLGLIYHTMEDDQPTAYATDAGLQHVAELDQKLAEALG